MLCHGINRSTLMTQKRNQELKRRVKNDICRSASHILVCISLNQQQKELFQALSLWRGFVFACREEEFASKMRQNSEQFNMLKQQYAKFAKTYDMLNSKYKNVMNKVATNPLRKANSFIFVTIIRQEEIEAYSLIL